MIIINIVLWVLSHFPVLCFSDDENFATLEYEKMKEGKTHLRFSLLNIMFGDCIIYFVTWDIKIKKLEMIHIIRLENMEGILLTDIELIGIQDRFKNHISELNANDMKIEKEKLCYHIQNEERRIDSSIGKINIYTTIILTIIPLALAIMDLKRVVTLPVSLIICVCFMLYALLNICAYIFRAIKVQGIGKSRFSDLRISNEKDKEILLQYQYDWQQLKHKAQLFVSYVLNLQEWVMLLLVLAICFAIGSSFNNATAKQGLERENINSVVNVNIEDMNEPYSNSAVEWQMLILDIEKEFCKEIIFIVNDKQKISFVDELKKYEDIRIKIMYDPTMSYGQLKIIREEYDEKAYFE